MASANDRYDFKPSFPETSGNLDWNQVAATGRDNQGGIARPQSKVSQDPLCEPADIFQIHGLPLSVGAYDKVVKAQREFDDRIKAGKGAIARPHFLNHYPAVPRTENMHHPAGQDALGEPICRALDERDLLFDAAHKLARTFEIL
jgi:hypothetical protein